MLLLVAALSLAAPVPKPGPDWVTVKGTVVWPEKEKIPEAKAYDPTPIKGETGDYIRKGGIVFDDTFLIDPKTRGLKNVVVSIRPDDDDPKAKFPAEKVHPDLAKAKAKTHTLTNEFCRYDKRVLAMRAGDTLEVVNNSKEAVLVRVTIGDDDKQFTMVPGQAPYQVKDLKAGWGWFDNLLLHWKDGTRWPADGRLWVLDHPYFAVTNENGEFEIPQVPRGKWRIHYHHESGWHKGKDGRLGFPVEVEGNKDAVMKMKPVEFERPKE